MAIVNCLIADDEPIAREIILNYCSYLPHLKVVASCSNALEAKSVIQQEKIDLLFLDINMPVLDGISFLKTLKNPPQVIFTTAYQEYALNAFDLAAVDYLLKPFSLERFIVAVDKAQERLKIMQASSPASASSTVVASNPASEEVQQDIFIKADNKLHRILFRDIIYAEANGNFTKIVTTHNSFLPSITFSGFEQQLPRLLFIRVHRSFIINKSFISHIEGNTVVLKSTEIPIGINYKEAFLKELGI